MFRDAPTDNLNLQLKIKHKMMHTLFLFAHCEQRVTISFLISYGKFVASRIYASQR